MVDLRVNVVRTACNNGNVNVVLVRVADGALTLDANVDVVFVLCQIRLLDSGDDLLFLDLRVLAAEILNGVLREALFVREFKVRHHKVEVRECGDVRLQKLRIVGNDGQL